MFDYDQKAKNSVDVLDKYDFSPLLKSCYGVDIDDIRDWLEEYGEEVSKEIMELTTDELVEYLHLRYGVRVEEVPQYYIWWNDRHGV